MFIGQQKIYKKFFNQLSNLTKLLMFIPLYSPLSLFVIENFSLYSVNTFFSLFSLAEPKGQISIENNLLENQELCTGFCCYSENTQDPIILNCTLSKDIGPLLSRFLEQDIILKPFSSYRQMWSSMSCRIKPFLDTPVSL